MNMNKCLVTGGTGYIGSHVSVELINQGFEVIILDNLSNSNIEVLKGIEKITGKKPKFEKVDLCDKEKTKYFFKRNSDIDSVIHFAALKAVGESVEKPLLYYKNNITSLLNLLESIKDCEIENFVFSSSCTVYGQPEKLPVKEDSPIKESSSPYGSTKIFSEQIIRDFTRSKNKFKCISLRYFNPIGAHESSEIGELPNGKPSNLVPFITQTVAGLHKELIINGNDYNTSDGTCIRDYINVVDLARAHVKALDFLAEEKNEENFEVFNLGTGKGSSVLEIINTFEKITGKKINYKIGKRRDGDMVEVWADTTKANQILGWKAEKTLEETLLSAWNWEKNYRGIK